LLVYYFSVIISSRFSFVCPTQAIRRIIQSSKDNEQKAMTAT